MAQNNSVGRPPIDVNNDIVIETYLKFGNIRDAAEFLGISKDTFHRRLKKTGVKFQKKVKRQVKVEII